MSVSERGEDMELIFVVYWILGYWAAGRTVYANKIRIGTFKNLVLTRAIVGSILGWILIPAKIVTMQNQPEYEFTPVLLPASDLRSAGAVFRKNYSQ